MTTIAKARETVLAYLKKRDITYEELDSEDKIYVLSDLILSGKYENITRDVYVVGYTTEGFFDPTPYFVHVDVETGKILYTLTEHGYIEPDEE